MTKGGGGQDQGGEEEDFMVKFRKGSHSSPID